MPSERVQRRIDQFLDEAEEALATNDWDTAEQRSKAVLALDVTNGDAATYLVAVARGRGESPSPAISSSDAPPRASPAPLPDSFAGGRYRVERFLGEGGKKRVFLAHDSTLDRDVAFGQFRTEGMDAAGRARVTQEAQAMGRVGAHPNLVAIYDIGEDSGAPFIVQEYVSGGSLADLAGDEPLPLAQTLRLAQHVCAALSFIHGQNLVHRDIKPSNVFLTEDGAAKVGDFGLAVGLDRTRITMQGGMIGTPSYMPPEQALAGDVTPQSDLYSLGAMLYELVTGRPPFVGDDPTSVISQHINTPPVAPSWHSEHCPPSLEALILSLLEKDPSKRPASAAEVATALAQVDPEETSARHSGSGDNPLEGLARGVFVGREPELERLRTAFDEAFAGRGSVVMLVGEPGIGKTRTTQELETYARMRGARVLWGRAHEASGAPAYWPWVQVGNHHARFVPPGDLAGDLDQSQVDELGRIFPALQAANPQPITDLAAAQFRLFDAYTAFMRAGSERAPLVIVLDDLHWADAPSLLLLQHLARELPRMRVLVIGTFRDTDLTRTHPLSNALAELNREGGTQRVVLRGLSEGEVATYIRAVAGTEPSPALVGRIYEETEGNPFFLAEVVNLMAQEGGFDGGADVVIPDGVREAIGRRLNLLSEEANELLTTAAVVGREFPFDTLALLFDGSNEELVGLINEGLRARVIEELEQPGRYEFTHAQMQETLLAEISTTSRVHLNARIADALEERYGEQAEARASRLAQHFFEASTLSDEYAEKAIRYSRVAAEQAAAQSGWGAAARHYEHCVALLANSSADYGVDAADLFRESGLAQVQAGEYRGGWRDLMRAADLYRERRDGPGLAETLDAASGMAIPLDRRAAMIDEALSLTDEADVRTRAWLLLAYFGRPDLVATARTLIDEHGLDDLRPALERQEGFVASEAGNIAEGARLLRGASDSHYERGEISEAVRMVAGYLPQFALLGDLDELESEALRGRKAADELNSTNAQAHARTHLASVRLLRGDIDGVEGVLTDRPFDDFSHDLLLGYCAELRGDEQEALRLIPAVSRAGGVDVFEIIMLAARARGLLRAGRVEDAREAFEGWQELWSAPIGTLPQRVGSLSEAIEAFDEFATDSLINDVLREVRTWTDVKAAPWTGRSADVVRGKVALLAGEDEEATRYFRSAIDWCRDQRCPIEEARARQGLADIAIREGELATALSELEAAQTLFGRHGARLYLDEVIAKKLELQGGADSDSQTSLVSLTTSLEEQRPDVASAVAPDGTVTLLFSDIEDSTKHNVELGDDAWMQLLGEHNRLVRDAIAANGGFEVKTEGDAFMVAFGSARDAVRCAQAMQRALDARNGEAEQPLRIRIGLHTGEPVREADDFYGTHVVLASRICSQASGGEILVSSLLRDLVASSGEFELTAREPAVLKGLDGEHVTYEVGWA